jgi:hypothetical protein
MESGTPKSDDSPRLSTELYEATILPQLNAAQAVPSDRAAPVLHPADFSRKTPAHLQIKPSFAIPGGKHSLVTKVWEKVIE